MPTPAPDRVRRGPFAALLILLGLLLTPATGAATANGLRAPAARTGASRQAVARIVLPPAANEALGDAASPPDDDPPVLTGDPRIVTEPLATRPRAEIGKDPRPARPEPPSASYRARAPPAS